MADRARLGIQRDVEARADFVRWYLQHSTGAISMHRKRLKGDGVIWRKSFYGIVTNGQLV